MDEEQKAKRTMLAAMAMQGFLANPAEEGDSKKVARDSVKFADDLIKELEKDGDDN